MRMRRIILSSVACLAVPYFSTLSHKRRDFGGGGILLNINCAFWFYPQLLRETFLNLRRIQRETIINESAHYSCQILMELEFSPLSFEKHQNIKVQENPSSGSRNVPCGRTGRQTWRTFFAILRTRLKVSWNLKKKKKKKSGGREDWTDLALDRDKSRALVNMVMNFRAPQSEGNFLTGWGTHPVRRTLRHDVISLVSWPVTDYGCTQMYTYHLTTRTEYHFVSLFSVKCGFTVRHHNTPLQHITSGTRTTHFRLKTSTVDFTNECV